MTVSGSIEKDQIKEAGHLTNATNNDYVPTTYKNDLPPTRVNQEITTNTIKENQIPHEQNFNNITVELNNYNNKIKKLVLDVSATSLLDLKPSTITQHKIELIAPEVTPIRQKMRRVPYSKRDEFKKMIDEMLEAKLIQPSNSPWSSPIYLVAKPDGSIRITVDYRLLNGCTRLDAHPLPNNEDLFASLAKSRWYTKLDLYSGYFQIAMDPDSRKYTAFSCEW